MIKLLSDTTQKVNRGILLDDPTHSKLQSARNKLKAAKQMPRDNNYIISRSLDLWHLQFDKEIKVRG